MRRLILTLLLTLSGAAHAQVVPVYRPPAATTWGVPLRPGGAATPAFRPVVPTFRPSPMSPSAGIRVAEPPPAPLFPVHVEPRVVDGEGAPLPSIGPAIPSLALPPASAGMVRPVAPVDPLAPLALPTYGAPQPLPPPVVLKPPVSTAPVFAAPAYGPPVSAAPQVFGPPISAASPAYGPPTQAGAAAGAWLSGAGPQPAPAPLVPRPPVNYSGWDTQPLRARSRLAAERSLWCGPGCTRQRAGQFSRGAWASETEVGPGETMPEDPKVWEATSSRCRAPGCRREAAAAVGEDGTWRIELYRPETAATSAERSWDQSVPPPRGNTAQEAINRAIQKRRDSK